MLSVAFDAIVDADHIPCRMVSGKVSDFKSLYRAEICRAHPLDVIGAGPPVAPQARRAQARFEVTYQRVADIA